MQTCLTEIKSYLDVLSIINKIVEDANNSEAGWHFDLVYGKKMNPPQKPFNYSAGYISSRKLAEWIVGVEYGGIFDGVDYSTKRQDLFSDKFRFKKLVNIEQDALKIKYNLDTIFTGQQYKDCVFLTR